MLRTILRLPFLYPVVAFLAARRVVMRGPSMRPTLSAGERVLFDTLAYRFDGPRKGDIVLARHPARPGIKLVKRVAGLPGDRLSAVATSTPGRTAKGRLPPTLGEDEYLLLGDAPDMSTDSRQLGPVRRSDIEGRAWLVYWPPHRMRRLRGAPPPKG